MYNHHLASPLYVIMLHQENDINAWFQYLGRSSILLFDSYSYMSRTKIMLVFFKKNHSLQHSHTALRYIWAAQFFDFTIVEVSRNGLVQLTSTPLKTIANTLGIGNSSKFFPEKMKNLHGLELRIGKNRNVSYRDNYGIHPAQNPRIHMIESLELFVSHRNISTTFLLFTTSNSVERLINNNGLAMMADNLVLFDMRVLKYGYITGTTRLVAIVPSVHSEFLDFSFQSILGPILGFCGSLGLSICAKWFLGSQGAQYSYLDIFQLLIGIGVSEQPPWRLPARIMFLTLMIFSIFGASDVIGILTTIQLQTIDALLVNGIDEIIEKNVTACSPHNPKYLTSFASEFTPKIHQTRLHTLNQQRCRWLKDGWMGSDVVILNELNAIDITTKYNQREDVSRNLEIVDLDLPVLPMAILFHPHTALRNEFAKFDRLVIETGLDRHWFSEYDFTPAEPAKDFPDIVEEDSGSTLTSLIIVLVIGLSSASLVFAMEVMKDSS